MKALLTLILTSISIYSSAQVISGHHEIKDIFRFNIISAVTPQKSEKIGPLFFYTNHHSRPSEILCHENIPRLNYRGAKGDELTFKFDDKNKCILIENCLKKLKKGAVLEVSVHRRLGKITNIIIPDSCLTSSPLSEELVLDVVF